MFSQKNSQNFLCFVSQQVKVFDWDQNRQKKANRTVYVSEKVYHFAASLQKTRNFLSKASVVS